MKYTWDDKEGHYKLCLGQFEDEQLKERDERMKRYNAAGERMMWLKKGARNTDYDHL